MGLDRCHGALQGIRVLLTEIVPVQAADPLQRIGRKIPPPDAEPGAGRAGIVERNRPFRMLRIDAQAKGQPAAVLRGPLPGPRQQAPFLGQGVENQMVAAQGQFVNICIGKGCGEAVHLAAEFFTTQPRLMGRAAADAVQRAGEQGEDPEQGKAFERQENFAARGRPDPGQNREIPPQEAQIHHKGRRPLEPGRIKTAIFTAVKAGHGKSTAFQGRP